MAHMSIEAQDFEARKARRLVDEAARRAQPDRYLLIVKVAGLWSEAHLFASEQEAHDYADIIDGQVQPDDRPEYSYEVVVVPTCFTPTDEVVVHTARGF